MKLQATVTLATVLLLTLGTLSVTSIAQGEESCVKVATIDINAVLNNLPESKAKKKEIDELTTSARAKLQAKAESLQALEKKIKEKSLPDDSEEAQKLRKDSREFERFQKDTQEDLQRHFLKINRELTDKTLKAVEAYAKAHKLDLVLDKAKDRGPILFGATAIDITSDVAKELK